MTLRIVRPIGAAVALLASASALRAQQTRLLDRAPSGAPATGWNRASAMSRDGEWIAFDQTDESLVPVDDHPNANIFVVQRSTGIITLESVSTAGVEADLDCSGPAISDDGRFVAFLSESATLIAGESPTVAQVYLRDREAGTTRRVSIAADGDLVDARCTAVAISGDGSLVCYVTASTNIDPALPFAGPHVWGWDADTGTTELITRHSDGTPLEKASADPAVDREGRCIAFTSLSSDHSDRDLNDNHDVLLRDRSTGTTEWISDPAPGTRLIGASLDPGISADGRFVAFTSWEVDVHSPLPDVVKVLLRDRTLGVTTHESPGAELYGDDWHQTSGPQVSADGRYLCWATQVPLLEQDDAADQDVYLRDRLLDLYQLVTYAPPPGEATRDARTPTISNDGRIVAFSSEDPDLVPDDGSINGNVFVREWPRDPASWTSYGSGFPGRDGVVPTMTPAGEPHIGAPLSIDFTNSALVWTFGFLYAGFDAIDLPTRLGGHLLVAPIVTIPVPLPPTGWRETFDVELDWSLSGLVVRAQTLEIDPWAAEGVSFTAGLELTLGY